MSLTLNEKFRDYIANAGGVTPDQLADCSYYTIQELNNTFRDPNLEKNLINVFHINIRSLNANHNKLLELMITLNYSFDVIVLTEIWNFNLSIYNNLLPDYNFIYEAPVGTNIGGVGIFIHNSFNFVKVDLKLESNIIDNTVESLFLEVYNQRFHCCVGGIYRHPNHNISKFTMSLEACIQSQKFPRNMDCILLGDFNLNLLNCFTHNDTSNFLDMINTYDFIPLTTLPTRLTETSSTLIDHIYYRPSYKLRCNLSDNCLTGILTVDITDHLANFLCLQPVKKIEKL